MPPQPCDRTNPCCAQNPDIGHNTPFVIENPGGTRTPYTRSARLHAGIRRTVPGRLRPWSNSRENRTSRRDRTLTSNLGVNIPFTSDVSEVEFVRSALKARGLQPAVGIMAEIPATFILLDRFLDMGVSSVVIGMNDLTSLVLGTARSTGRREMCHPALMKVISDAREVTGRYGVTLSIAGYMPRELVEASVQLGCDYAVLHYSYLPTYFPGQYDGLPELEKLQDIKKKTRSMIAAYMREKNSL